jgi:DNA-binding transcriptional regulator YhcF (GntR family)
MSAGIDCCLRLEQSACHGICKPSTCLPNAPATPPSQRPRVDVIADALRHAIVSGTVAPGEPLRQDAIAADFGVSHIPVREALRHLAAEGLVTLKRNHGATVRGMSPDEALELLEIRGTLETQALRWALPKSDPALCDEAAHLLDEAERLEDPSAWLSINWRFHRLLTDRRAAGSWRSSKLDRRIDGSCGCSSRDRIPPRRRRAPRHSRPIGSATRPPCAASHSMPAETARRLLAVFAARG